MSEASTTNSVSKKSPFVWIVIYILIGLIVYGLIYYFAFSKKSAGVPSEKPTVSDNEGPTDSSQVVTMDKVTVILTEDGFVPDEIVIAPGSSVTWVNQAGKTATVDSGPHPAHTDYASLNLGSFNSGETLTLTFDTKGKFEFHNHFDESQAGTVIVE